MKIVHTEASCGWGGQEIRILNEARGMIARGHDVRLVCPEEARICAEAPNFGVPVIALPIGRKNIGGLFTMRAWLAAEQRRAPIDVINTHSSTDTWLTAVALATLRDPRGPVLVRTRHISAPVPDNFSTRWLYGTASSMIVTTGESLRETLIRDNHFDGARIMSIPTGIDLGRYVPATPESRAAARSTMGISDDRFTVGIVATLRSWKGHRYLIDAIARRIAAGATLGLVIVGDGPQREALEAQVNAGGLSDVVQFAGNQTDVLPWLHGMDAFALPSYANEGVPQAILQAMACALPVVTTSAGAIGEVARDGDTALVVAQENATELAAALERLQNDAGLRARLGAQAHALVVERHGIEAMLDRMVAVFDQAVATRRPIP